MSTSFDEWFQRETKDKGNDKLYRNRLGMKMAWEAGREEQLEGRLLLTADEYVDAINMARKDQRHECAERAGDEAFHCGCHIINSERIYDAALNAVRMR